MVKSNFLELTSDANIISQKFGDLLIHDEYVITGGSGMLGTYFYNLISRLSNFAKSNKRIFVLSRNAAELNHISSHFRDLRFLNYHEFEKLKPHGSRHFIHCASPSRSLSTSSIFPGLFDTNIEFLYKILSEKLTSQDFFTFLSSGEVYGSNSIVPLKENEVGPVNHLDLQASYGEAKRFAEVILFQLSDLMNLNTSAIRTFHTFGPGIDLSDTRIFSYVFQQLSKGETISLNSNGEARRSFLYSGDLLSAILIAAKQKGFHVFNVAANSDLSISDFTSLAVKCLSPDGAVKVILNGNNSGTHINYGLADTCAIKGLGWEPIFDLEYAFKATFASLKY